MNELDFSKIGLKMKQLRIEQGITQERVAEDLGCTVSFVSNAENNRTKLNLRLLVYYASLCHVSVDTLLNAGRNVSEKSSEDQLLEEEVLQIFQTFSPEERRKIIKMMQIWKND